MMAEVKVTSCDKQWKGKKRTHNSGRKLRGNRPHGRNTCKLENNTNIDVKEIKWDGMNWILLVHDRHL
jgi:hypothetical protein